MEIAATGFNPQFGATVTADAAQQRQRQQQAQQQSEAAGRRSEQAQTRAENSSRTPENARVINGEVLSSETTRVGPRDSANNLQARSSDSQQSPSGQPDTRRVSIDQAMQNFQQNEAMVSNQANPRQVSGIIDEFV